MVYNITVDGIKEYVETPLFEYTRQADEEARVRIEKYIKKIRDAKTVEFHTSFEEACELHKKAKKFYDQTTSLLNLISNFPEKPWEFDEMNQLIPQLMKIYIMAMELPDPEYMEDMDYKREHRILNRRITFSEKYDYYWTVYDPYCLYAESEEGVIRDKEAVRSWLTDDLADIIIDLENGISAYKAGLVCEAIFSWRFDFIIHYGEHIVNALHAMTSLWEYNMRNRGRIRNEYWAYDSESIIVPQD